MGVPKFYRWMSERYPCLSQVVQSDNVPEIDNFYLDMNGIVHQCSHPSDLDPSVVWTEDKIFENVFAYLDHLVMIIRPKRLLYMAIDGVAPRAKMNQQRARRFRSADEAAAEAKRLADKGISVQGKFDSNSITPGTPFMVRLAQQLAAFVERKLTADPLWRVFKVIISGHEVPGEGEHKIMDYIRFAKRQPDYDTHMRHCLYGLDADLILLGLASHEPYFFLLREQQTFGKKKPKKDAGVVNFDLLSLTLFREYINLEFRHLQTTLPFAWDFERLLDDWILLTFLVGNDFLPHLPGFHIGEDIFPTLWRAYAACLHKAGGYIAERGVIHMPRLEALFRELDAFDRSAIENKMQDMAFVQSKSGPQGYVTPARKQLQAREAHQAPPAPLDAPPAPLAAPPAHAHAAPQAGLVSFFGEEPPAHSDGLDGSDDAEIVEIEFRQQKRHYYMEKLKVQVVDDAFLDRFCKDYVRGLQWCLLYYFQGVPSWGWFFEHHYTPYVSDLRNISDFRPQFELSKPFMPFQQLLSVMPAACAGLLPEAYRDLMTSPHSPIVDFYPTKYETDLNGKKQDWEALILIPFIDEKRLLAAAESRDPYLAPDDRARNRHSQPLLVEPSPQGAPRLTTMPWPHCTPGADWYPSLSADFQPALLLPGVPTLSFVNFNVEMRRGVVHLFDRPTTGESVILQLQTPTAAPNLAAILHELKGQKLYYNWPYLREARLVAVCNGVSCHSLAGQSTLSPAEQTEFSTTYALLAEKLLRRRGTSLPEGSVIVYVNPSVGATLQANADNTFSMRTQFSAEEVPVPLQLLVRGPKVFTRDTSAVSLTDAFPVGDAAFFVGTSLYGSFGQVVGLSERQGAPCVCLQLQVPSAGPSGPSISDERELLNGRELATRLGINLLLLMRIAGSVYTTDGHGRADLGLGLLGPNKTENPKFVRRVPQVAFTPLGERTIREYVQAFASTVADWERQFRNGGENTQLITSPEAAAHIKEYLAGLPFRKDPLVAAGSMFLASARLRQIAQFCVSPAAAPSAAFKIDVPPANARSAFMLSTANAGPDPGASIEVGDRIVTVRGPVPANPTTGTVVALYPDATADVVLDAAVEEGTNLDGICPMGHGIQLPLTHLLSVSHGNRIRGGPLIAPKSKKELGAMPPVPVPALQTSARAVAPVAAQTPDPVLQAALTAASTATSTAAAVPPSFASTSVPATFVTAAATAAQKPAQPAPTTPGKAQPMPKKSAAAAAGETNAKNAAVTAAGAEAVADAEEDDDDDDAAAAPGVPRLTDEQLDDVNLYANMWRQLVQAKQGQAPALGTDANAASPKKRNPRKKKQVTGGAAPAGAPEPKASVSSPATKPKGPPAAAAVPPKHAPQAKAADAIPSAAPVATAGSGVSGGGGTIAPFPALTGMPVAPGAAQGFPVGPAPHAK